MKFLGMLCLQNCCLLPLHKDHWDHWGPWVSGCMPPLSERILSVSAKNGYWCWNLDMKSRAVHCYCYLNMNSATPLRMVTSEVFWLVTKECSDRLINLLTHPHRLGTVSSHLLCTFISHPVDNINVNIDCHVSWEWWSPEHWSPWLSRPYSNDPQWSQKVGLE